MCKCTVGLALTSDDFRRLTIEAQSNTSLEELVRAANTFNENRESRAFIVLFWAERKWHEDAEGEGALMRFIMTQLKEVDFLRCSDEGDVAAWRLGKHSFFTKEVSYRVVRA